MLAEHARNKQFSLNLMFTLVSQVIDRQGNVTFQSKLLDMSTSTAAACRY